MILPKTLKNIHVPNTFDPVQKLGEISTVERIDRGEETLSKLNAEELVENENRGNHILDQNCNIPKLPSEPPENIQDMNKEQIFLNQIFSNFNQKRAKSQL